jgi:hypothetical protein
LKFANGSTADSGLVAGMSGMCILLGLGSLNWSFGPSDTQFTLGLAYIC